MKIGLIEESQVMHGMLSISIVCQVKIYHKITGIYLPDLLYAQNVSDINYRVSKKIFQIIKFFKLHAFSYT